jgi:hypothetical protein
LLKSSSNCVFLLSSCMVGLRIYIPGNVYKDIFPGQGEKSENI